MEHLVKRWELAGLSGLNGEAAAAQEYLIKLPNRIRSLSERAAARKAKAKQQKANFSWVFGREVLL